MHEINICTWAKRNWVRRGSIFTEGFVTVIMAGRLQRLSSKSLVLNVHGKTKDVSACDLGNCL